MKLRFGVDPAQVTRIRDALDTAAKQPPSGRRLCDVYLDTAEGDLAARGVFLRFRRSAALGTSAPKRPWRRQWVWPKGDGAPASPKALGIRGLRQRVDATFQVRVERWTWQAFSWAEVSLDAIAISTGRAEEKVAELRIRCKRKRRDEAIRVAVELGAASLVSRSIRERGLALLQPASPVERDLAPV